MTAVFRTFREIQSTEKKADLETESKRENNYAVYLENPPKFHVDLDTTTESDRIWAPQMSFVAAESEKGAVGPQEVCFRVRKLDLERERSLTLEVEVFKSIDPTIELKVRESCCLHCGDNRHSTGDPQCLASKVKCLVCRNVGHFARCCPSKQSPLCHDCWNPGHNMSECPTGRFAPEADGFCCLYKNNKVRSVYRTVGFDPKLYGTRSAERIIRCNEALLECEKLVERKLGRKFC